MENSGFTVTAIKTAGLPARCFCRILESASLYPPLAAHRRLSTVTAIKTAGLPARCFCRILESASLHPPQAALRRLSTVTAIKTAGLPARCFCRILESASLHPPLAALRRFPPAAVQRGIGALWPAAESRLFRLPGAPRCPPPDRRGHFSFFVELPDGFSAFDYCPLRGQAPGAGGGSAGDGRGCRTASTPPRR